MPPASITPSCSACGEAERIPKTKNSPCATPTPAKTRLAVLTAFGEAKSINAIRTTRLRGQTPPARENIGSGSCAARRRLAPVPTGYYVDAAQAGRGASMNRRWIIPMGLLLSLAAFSLVTHEGQPGKGAGPLNPGDVAWMLTATGLVLLMTPGLSFFYGGMVSPKSVISTMLQSFVALGVISLLWVAVGFSLAFGDDIGGFIGNPFTYAMFRGVGTGTNAALAPTIPLLLFAMFQLKFAVITPALVSGSFAERVRFSA